MIRSLKAALRWLMQPFQAKPGRVREAYPDAWDTMPRPDMEQLVPVSRHGLEDFGVTCPACGERAVAPGDWRKVHIREVRLADGRLIKEEGVCCSDCNLFLLASPDSDVDPLEHNQDYDPEVYHKFARPPGWEPPKQKTAQRMARPGDWVVFAEDAVVEVEGSPRQLGGAEGRFMELTEDGQALVRVGTKIQNIQTKVPLTHIQPMLFETIKEGDTVKVTKNVYKDLEGEVQSWNKGELTVYLFQPKITLTLPIEHFELVASKQDEDQSQQPDALGPATEASKVTTTITERGKSHGCP